MDAGTQAPAHMQGNGQHQRRAAGVCAKHKHTRGHTRQKGFKPEITLSAHVNLTPHISLPAPRRRNHRDVQGYIQWALISGPRELQSLPPERLPQPGRHPVAGLGELGHRWWEASG